MTWGASPSSRSTSRIPPTAAAMRMRGRCAIGTRSQTSCVRSAMRPDRRSRPIGFRHRGDMTGTVYLVGAGPGAPDLLTLRAAKLLARADLIVHDGLVDPAVMALAGTKARFVSVAKSRA